MRRHRRRFDRGITICKIHQTVPREKATKRGGKAPPRRGRVLPDDACIECGTIMVERRSALRTKVNGEEIAVPAAAHLHCPKCGEKMFRYDDMKRLGQDSIAIYRKRYGLLSADDVRAIRERFDLTQLELARLLRRGENTVSRWEAGRNVQTGAMDLLLRILRDVPGSIAYLRKHAT